MLDIKNDLFNVYYTYIILYYIFRLAIVCIYVMRVIPWVLMGSGALALVQSVAQCGAEKTKVKQQLQGSVLSHGKNTLLDNHGTE